MADPTRCSAPKCVQPVHSRGLCGSHYTWAYDSGLLAHRVNRNLSTRKADLAERVWAKIERHDGHWLWVGAALPSGYGIIQVDGEAAKAHRVVYELLVEPIPEGLHIDHLCRIPACVNPAHLEPVTALQNTWRSPITNATKTHCPQGHPYDEANTYVYNGRRHCRTCGREHRRRWAERQHQGV